MHMIRFASLQVSGILHCSYTCFHTEHVLKFNNCLRFDPCSWSFSLVQPLSVFDLLCYVFVPSLGGFRAMFMQQLRDGEEL